MALTQKFRLIQVPGAFGAEYACADVNCTGDGTTSYGVMTDTGGEEGGLTMAHRPECIYGGDRAQTGASDRQ
jgi:hypothetical protein